jgi:hypothetical protein
VALQGIIGCIELFTKQFYLIYNIQFTNRLTNGLLPLCRHLQLSKVVKFYRLPCWYSRTIQSIQFWNLIIFWLTFSTKHQVFWDFSRYRRLHSFLSYFINERRILWRLEWHNDISDSGISRRHTITRKTNKLGTQCMHLIHLVWWRYVRQPRKYKRARRIYCKCLCAECSCSGTRYDITNIFPFGYDRGTIIKTRRIT